MPSSAAFFLRGCGGAAMGPGSVAEFPQPLQGDGGRNALTGGNFTELGQAHAAFLFPDVEEARRERGGAHETDDHCSDARLQAEGGQIFPARSAPEVVLAAVRAQMAVN